MTSLTQSRRGLGGRLAGRLLHWFFLTKRGLTIGVRAVVRCRDGKFLLLRHTYLPGWHFPGGGVERGETAETALGNELFQETGLRLAQKPVLHGVFFNKGVSKRDHVLVYLCEVQGEAPTKASSIEIAEYGFFAADELPQDIDPGTARRIREIAEGAERHEAW
ncbi:MULTISPECIES: NUDIX domain-containing protein [Shimia]|uniref:NUDIX domain-containing protein n=1 Tax=Shimia TaxID=573139 RepID=UPI00243662CE|nr:MULTISPECIES: NUDIX domain-containing protein [Shimia]MDV4144307.1 NUDIX domain-containing protein [Shimia sp. FJ5]